MLKILLLFCAIEFSYATTNCHELQKSPLASLNDRITQMLNSLYTPPLAAKSKETTSLSTTAADTPTNEYTRNPYESNYYPAIPLPPSQVFYVAPPFTPAIYGAPAMYAPPSTAFTPPPVSYTPPPPMALAALPPALHPAMAIPPPMSASPAIYTLSTQPTPVPQPTIPSPFHHLESKGQPFVPYSNVPAPIAPWNQHYEPHYTFQYPSTPSPYPLPSPPIYSSEYNSPYPEYPASPQLSPKLMYTPPPQTYLPPHGYLPNAAISYPPFYPKQYELPPTPYYM